MEIEKRQGQGHQERHDQDNAQRKPKPKHGGNSSVNRLRGLCETGSDPLCDSKGSDSFRTASPHRQRSKRLTISEIFCPPKPKLLLRAWRTRFSRATLGT